MKMSALLLLVLSLAAYGQDRPRKRMGGGEKGGAQRFKSLKDQQPPELVSTESDWLNVKKPLTLKELKGLVVVLEFSNHT